MKKFGLKMNIFFRLAVILFITLCTNLSASQKQADNIAQISAVSLYNIDKNSLQNTIKVYIKNNPTLKALRIKEILSGKEYISIYKDEEGNFIEDKFPSNIESFASYKAISLYQGEKVGEIFAYFVKNDSLNLTNDEKKWLAKKEPIKYIYDPDWAPFEWKNGIIQHDGIIADILQIIKEKSGINLVVEHSNSWEEALQKVKNGSADMVSAMSESDERKTYVNFTNKELFSVPNVFITREKTDFPKGFESIKNKRITLIGGYLMESMVKKDKPNLKYSVVGNVKEGLAKLQNKETDIFVANLATAQYMLNQKKYSDLKISYHTKYIFDLKIAIRKNYPKIALSIINKTLNQITKDEIRNIYEKWFIKSKVTIELNDKEKKWVRNNPKVNVIEFFDEPPFTLNTQGKSGYIYELLEYLIESAGLKINYVGGFTSYNSMLESIEKGENDILTTFPTSLDLGDTSNIKKTKSILNTSFVVIGKGNSGKIGNIEELFGKKIAVVKGYAQDNYLSKFPQIKKVHVSNNEEGFEAIRTNKADFYINNRANSEYILTKSFSTDLQIVHQLSYEHFPPFSISFAINGQKKELVSILEKALKKMPLKKINEIKDKWIVNTNKDKNIIFTKKEKEWLNKNLSIRLAYMNYWPTDDNSHNVHTEYINLLSKYGNVNITLVKYDEWKTAFESAKKGKDVYGVLNLSWSEERERNSFDYTNPYHFIPAYLIVKKANNSIKSFEDLKNKSIFLKDKSITNEIVKELKYNITPTILKTEKDIHKALSQKDSKTQALLTYTKDPELLEKYDLKIANKFFSKYGEIHIGTSKNQKELYSIINKIYDAIPKNELTRIQTKDYNKKSNVKVELTKEEKAFIFNNPKIKVHNEKSWPPFNFYEFGQPKGYSIDLIKLVAKNTGLNIEFITGPTWDEFLQMMKKDQLDIMLNIKENEERKEYMLFTDSYIKASMGIAIHKDNTNINNFDDVLDKTVALENGFFNHDYFNKNHKDTNVLVVDDSIQALQAVEFKKADATIALIPVMKYIAQKNFITELKYLTDENSPITKPMSLRFSTRKNTPLLQSILQKGLASITPKEHNELTNRWLGIDNKDEIQVQLTDEEKKWLSEHKNIRFTGDPIYFPYEGFDENGNYGGMVAEYIDIFEKTLDIKFEKIRTNSWSESLEKAQNQEVDVLSNYTNDNSLKDIHLSTKSYIKSPIGVFTKNDIKKITDINELKNKKIAVVKGYGYLKDILENYPNLNYIEVDNARIGLIGVSNGDYDAMICSTSLGIYKISEHGLHNLHIALQTDYKMELGLGIRKDWEPFVNIINKVINKIPKGTSQEITKNWIGEYFELTKKVDLTQKERSWLKKKGTLRYVYDIDWEPFEWKNELDEHSGIIKDILSLIEQRSGINFEQINTNNWSQAVSLMKNDKADMYSGFGENEDRKKYLNFTNSSIFKTPYVFVARGDDKNDYLETFKTIKDKKVAVVDGYTIHGIINDNKPNLPLKIVKTVKDGFENLRDKEIDIFVVNAATAKYYINRLGYDDLRIATKTEFNLDLKIALQKEIEPEAISILDKAIDSISEKELSDIYFKWTEVLVEERTDWSLLYKLGGGFLLLLVGISYWNRKLKKAVDSKTDELQKLLGSFDENVIASKTDSKGNIVYASKAFCEISGFTQEELIGSPQSIVRHPDMPKSLFKDLWQTIKQGKTWRGEVKNKKKNGGFYWVDVVVTPEFDHMNNIVGYSAIRQEITSKKEVEDLSKNLELKVVERTAEVHKAQKKFTSMVSNVPGAIYRVGDDSAWPIIYMSDEIENITGYPALDFIESKIVTFSTIMYPDDVEPIGKIIQEQFSKGKNFQVDYRVISKSGDIVWVRSQGQSVKDDDNSYIDGVLIDITKSKEAEEKLELLSELVYGSLKSASVGAWWVDFTEEDTFHALDNTVEMIGINYKTEGSNACAISGWAGVLEQTATLSDEYKDAVDATFENFTGAISGKYESYHAIFPIAYSNGKISWIEARADVPKRDKDGKALLMTGTLIDITDIKQAQAQIEENRLFLNTLLDSQEQIIITTDGELLISTNESFLKFFNVSSREEFIENIGECICDTFDINSPQGYLQIMMGEKKWIDYVVENSNKINKAIINMNDTEYTFSVTAAILPGEDNLKSAVFTNITELENARKNIETILSNIMLPVLITSKEDRIILYANEYASIQYEAPVEELVGKSIDSVYTSINQKDEILTIMEEQGYIENIEEIYKTQKGKEFIGLLSVKPIVYNSEESYIGMVVDITEQKDIEDEIRRIHKHTKDSIEYAALIQHALIPSNDLIGKYFSDTLTIWHPKDIVGGDIYLFEELRTQDECLLMVIDCTGHGVPGAFVSMLVKAIERQVVAKIDADKSIDVSPAWILSYFNKTMKKLLKQNDDDAISNAGFDGGVIYYNKKENIVKFAGAETPLFYFEDGKLNTIKGNRHSIGYKKSDVNYEFTDHTIEAKEGMQFYLSTDGYFDQNGGEKGFPFGKKKFMKIIEENYEESFADQKEILFDTLQDYQKDEDRNDDVTIIAFKI